MDEQFTKKLQEKISSFQDQIGTLSSMVDLAAKTTDAEKVRNQAGSQALAVVKESVSTGEKTAAKLQKLNSGSRICKPQGTLHWPNMAPNNGSSPIDTAPSVSSPTTSAPPQLPYHHHHHQSPTNPIRPVPERAYSTTIFLSPGSKRHVSIAIRTAASKQHFSPSMLKRETASAWECIGSSGWSKVMASVLNAGHPVPVAASNITCG